MVRAQKNNKMFSVQFQFLKHLVDIIYFKN